MSKQTVWASHHAELIVEPDIYQPRECLKGQLLLRESRNLSLREIYTTHERHRYNPLSSRTSAGQETLALTLGCFEEDGPERPFLCVYTQAITGRCDRAASLIFRKLIDINFHLICLKQDGSVVLIDLTHSGLIAGR